MKKTMTIILVIGLVFMTGLLLIEKARFKNLEAQSLAEKEKIEELEKQNLEIDGQLRNLAQINQTLEQKLAEYEKEKTELNQKLRESEHRLKEIQSLVATLTPDAMVQETRRILQDNGVEKIDTGARFTLVAFRKNTGILFEWEEFSLARIPTLERKIENLEKSNLNLQNQVFLWKETDRLWRQKNTLWLEEKMALNKLIINYDKQIRSQKRQKVWTFILGGLAGFGIHALISK
jgi:chromosome segregation ATPase